MVQVKKHTKGKRNRRRSHLALAKTFLTDCPKCGRAALPHRVCAYCGFYDGREAVDVLARLTKKEKKKRLKEEAAAHEAHSRQSSGQKIEELNPEELSKK